MKFNIIGIDISIADTIVLQMADVYKDTGKELGGILLGRFSDCSKIIEITEIIEIETKNHSPVSYCRNVKTAQTIIDRKWNESNGEINYLGEWHTHPGMKAIPSTTDINSMVKMGKHVEKYIPFVVLMIFGKNNEVNIIVRKGSKNHACIFNR